MITSLIEELLRRHLYKYMLRIAGKTAGPIGLNFFVDTHGWLGGVIDLKNRIFFFHGHCRALQLVEYKTDLILGPKL